jgi:hypothetical protein
MNFRTTANPANAMDINNAELPASGTVGGGRGVANDVPVTITTAMISRPTDNFDFCILISFFCWSYRFKPMLLGIVPLTEAGAAFVGAGWGGGGGIANDFSTDNSPNNATNTNTEHAPIIFFILWKRPELFSCQKNGFFIKPLIASHNRFKYSLLCKNAESSLLVAENQKM